MYRSRANSVYSQTTTVPQSIIQSGQLGHSVQSSQTVQSSQPTQSSQIFSRTGTMSQSNGFGSTSTNTTISSNSDNIIFAIVTGNLFEVTRLVNSSNVNNVIDTKNRYTALHYAVKLPNNDIVSYLMKCGADPNIKQNEGKDSIDLSIESNKRFLVDKILSKTNKELDDVYTKLDENKHHTRSIERKNKELEESNNYLTKVNGEYVKKIDDLKEENKNIKRKLEDSEKAFENLLKKNRK